MRAEIERLFDGAFWEIVRGIVAENRGAVVGELRVLELINLAGSAASADARRSRAYRDDRRAVGALGERAGVCGDAPRGPLARFVRGGFSFRVSEICLPAARRHVGRITLPVIS